MHMGIQQPDLTALDKRGRYDVQPSPELSFLPEVHVEDEGSRVLPLVEEVIGLNDDPDRPDPMKVRIMRTRIKL